MWKTREASLRSLFSFGRLFMNRTVQWLSEDLEGRSPMSITSSDTTIEAARCQIAVLRRQGIDGRARMTIELCDNLRKIIADGIRHRHPEYDDEAIQMGVFRSTLGEALFRQYIGRSRSEE